MRIGRSRDISTRHFSKLMFGYATVRIPRAWRRLLTAMLEQEMSVHCPANDKTLPGSLPPPQVTHPDILEQPGDIIGQYKLLRPLGEGGMGSVWLAEQSHPVHRSVALKVIKPGMDSKRIIARFNAERQALALMDHPNVAHVYEAGTTPSGRPFFVMELAGDQPITRYCDDRKLDLRARLELFGHVCHAIQHAHHKGVIHRDIKPTNVLISELDGEPVPKVIDFGLAKVLHQQITDSTIVTEIGTMIGTPEYMSPEQAGPRPFDIDTRSDVYSLGVLLYELLTGTPPFEFRKRQLRCDEVLRVLREEEPPRPSLRLRTNRATIDDVSTARHSDRKHLTRELRGDLDWIVMRALEKDRTRRYQTANGLAADVHRYLMGEPVSVGPPSPLYRLKKLAQRHRSVATFAATVLLALLAGVIGTTWGMIESIRSGNRARTAEVEAKLSAHSEADQCKEAEKQRDRAHAAEKQARESEEVAKAVNEFLHRDLLGQASPRFNARQKQVTVEELLTRASAQVPAKFANKPMVEAAIRQTIGDTFMALGHYEAAEPHMERAKDIYLALFGFDADETLTSTGNLAQVYYNLGKYADAESIYSKLIKHVREKLGDNDPLTISVTSDLASVYKQQGKYADAEPLYVTCFEARANTMGERSPLTLKSMNNLGDVYRKRNKYDLAETLLQRCLELRREVLGEEDVETLTSMNNLASLYQDRGRYRDAEELYIDCQRMRDKVLGSGHPDTLRCQANLGEVYRAQKMFEKAEPLLASCYAAQRDSLGEDHVDTITTMNHLATLYRQRGQFARAEPLMRRNLEIARESLGNTHQKTLLNINSLARLNDLMGRSDEAERLYVECSEAAVDTFGPSHRNTLAMRCNLANFYVRSGRPELAETIYSDCLPLLRKAPGNDHALTQSCTTGLAFAYLELNQFDRAEPLARESLKWNEKKEPNERLTAEIRGLLGAILLRQKKYADAEPQLLTAFANLAKRPSDLAAGVRPITPTTLANRLAELYTAKNEPAKAMEWKNKAAEGLRE